MLVMVKFRPTSGSRHMPLIRNTRRQMTGYTKQSFPPGTSPNRFQRHTSSRVVSRPQGTHPPEESLPRRSCLLSRTSWSWDHYLPSWAKWRLQSTPLISTYIYGVCYVARSSHILKVVTLFQCRLLRKIAGITPAIIGIIHAVTKKSQRVNHAVMKIRINCTLKEDSPSLNTLRYPLRKGTNGQK